MLTTFAECSSVLRSPVTIVSRTGDCDLATPATCPKSILNPIFSVSGSPAVTYTAWSSPVVVRRQSSDPLLPVAATDSGAAGGATPPGASDGLPAGARAGIGVAVGLVGLLALALLGWWLLRMRRRKPRLPPPPPGPAELAAGTKVRPELSGDAEVPAELAVDGGRPWPSGHGVGELDGQGVVELAAAPRGFEVRGEQAPPDKAPADGLRAAGGR